MTALTLSDLYNHQLEQMYFILIMMGACTGVVCLTLLIGFKQISEAILKSAEHRNDVLDLRRAFGAHNRRLMQAEGAVQKLGVIAKRLVEFTTLRPAYNDGVTGD